VDVATKWIDEHPDTVMVSAADQEIGGLTLTGYDPRPLKAGRHSSQHLGQVWSEYDSDDCRDVLYKDILPSYGISTP
jgi:alkaline phosphatase